MDDEQITQWMLRVRALGQTGLAFSESLYERERYQELLKVAAEMEATLDGRADEVGRVEQITAESLAQVAPGVAGYVTPKVGSGAIVFNARDELLLVNRADGRGWFPPVGFADVGYTPAQVAVKETWEETGLRVTPLRLVGVYDNRLHSYRSRVHIYRLLFYCRLDGGELQGHPLETLDVGFFAREGLPQPLAGNPVWVEHAFAAHAGTLTQTYFDALPFAWERSSEWTSD